MEPEPSSPRDRLLAAAVDYVAANGLSDLSLRQLAAALGTSHRMLIYHFGSKGELVAEIIRSLEAWQREVFVDIASDPDASTADIARRMWQQLSQPQYAAHQRLFFEMYGQALQGRPGTTGMLEGIVGDWLDPAEELVRAKGVPEETARAAARLGLAVSRGLLLDLLATGDREGVDAAMEAYLRVLELAPGA